MQRQASERLTPTLPSPACAGGLGPRRVSEHPPACGEGWVGGEARTAGEEGPMTPEQTEMAAEALAKARGGQAIAGLPAAARPQSEVDCYAIQEAVLRRLGEKIGG